MLSSSTTEKIQAIEHHFAKIMEALGLDLQDPALSETPARVARMYVEELFSGLDPDNFPKIAYFDPPSSQEKNLVMIRNIQIESMCEHHFVPISGRACVAYLPNQKLIGLSKIPRLVRYFCRRPQLQERLTTQIATALSLLLETENVAVKIKAHHYCVSMRGARDAASQTITQELRGKFQTDPILSQQFISN